MARRRNASYRGAQTVHFAALVLCEAPQAAQLFGHVVALTTRPHVTLCDQLFCRHCSHRTLRDMRACCRSRALC